MRAVLWLCAFIVGLTGVLLPALYLYYASQIPVLDTQFDLERILRGTIEGERRSHRSGAADEEKVPTTWPRPDLQALPRDFVALYISGAGCPAFFQTPREASTKAMWRAFRAFILKKGMAGNSGRCELLMGSDLTNAAGIKGDWETGIASLRIRTFLTKDQLVAFDVTSMRLGDAIFGVDDAARDLFQRKATDLSLADQAVLVLPFVDPQYPYNDVKLCKAPILLKQHRDAYLDKLARDGLVPPERAKAAEDEPLSCLKG